MIISKVIENPYIIIDKLKGYKLVYLEYCRIVKNTYGDNFKTVIDIGANKGDFIDVVLSKFPDASIYAVEPLKRCHEILLTKPIEKLFPIALSDKVEVLPFYESNGTGSKSSFIIESDDPTYVKTYRFDDLNLKIRKPCLVKIDAEGYDGKIIKGMGKRLQEVDAIIFEYNPLFKQPFGETITYLENNGFINFIQARWNMKENGSFACDMICMRGKNAI